MHLPTFPAANFAARADAAHRDWLLAEAKRQVDFFRPSLRPDGSFAVLDYDGKPLPGQLQELHTTTRLIHSFALAHALGLPDCMPMIDAGMAFLWNHHRDAEHGGYVWAVAAGQIVDDKKLAYGHVFVLLAAASAMQVGHPDAARLMEDISAVLDQHFWEEGPGLFQDEFTRDWQVFSDYRGMNANMHGVEALLAAYEASGAQIYLQRAGRILDFFTAKMGPAHGWRLPEHYHADWRVAPDYQGNPMFRPAGTTPGHSLEIARLLLQYRQLTGAGSAAELAAARHLIEVALADAWVPGPAPTGGGLVYTLKAGGAVSVPDRYWWPVCEAIAAIAMLQNAGAVPEDEARYRQLWQFADQALIDHQRGGWYPELDAAGAPTDRQFQGKPDIYHAFQATLLPLVAEESRLLTQLAAGVKVFA